MSRWFRHYAGMMRDDKMVRVSIRTKQPIERVLWVWGAILESAAEIDDAGRYDFDRAEAAYFLRADETDVGAIEDGLAGAGRIDSGFVVKWGDRQFQSDRSATRQAAYRERKRQESAGDQRHCNRQVTSPSRHRDAPETETETDISVSKDTSVRTPRTHNLKSNGFPAPEGVSDESWQAFCSQRKKRMTRIAYDRILNTLADGKRAGWPPGEMIDRAIERGWETVFVPKVERNGQRANEQSTSGYGRTGDALQRFVREAEARESG